MSQQPGNPVVEARISDKFAFVQFRTCAPVPWPALSPCPVLSVVFLRIDVLTLIRIEETNNALGLDGIMFMGSQLKIGRPKAYVRRCCCFQLLLAKL